MKVYVIYLMAGLVFSLGLLFSGMADSSKIVNFLSVGAPEWNEALLFVLFSAVLVYFFAFQILKKAKRTLNGGAFKMPAKKGVDQKLIIGSLLFGIGWGLSGLCPGPAIVHLAYPTSEVLIFMASMIVGFELQRRFY